MCHAVLACLFAQLLGSGVAQVVNTEYGQVRGHQLEVDNGRDVSTVEVFLGIPFAQDTSGENRFRGPIKRTPWAGILDADTLGDVCPQSPGATLGITHPDWDRMSEDCLHLNIYSPDVSGGPYAVMVWFYGGAYSSGANIQYPGYFLASHDVVVVTVNYRVNTFGFAYTATAAVPGNAGLWDQNMGLQFVVDNIANFGGDPSRITIFGESAGATSSSLHMMSPFSKDLFQQAIMESGAEVNVWAIIPPSSNPEERFYRGAESMGCNITDEVLMMECMRSFSWENIHENGTGFGSAPVVDGPGGFLPKTPEELRAEGNIMTGPIISGINHDDASPVVPLFAPETLFGCCNRTYFRHIIENRLVGLLGFFLDNVTQAKIAEGMLYNFSPWPHIYSNWLNRNAFGQIATDVAFGTAWNQQVSRHQEVGPTYAYVYNYRGRNSTSLIPEWMGVPHIAEIPYVWGHTLLPRNEAVRNDSLIDVDLVDWTEEDIEHTVFLQDLWTNFAKTGNPTPTPVPNPIGDTTVWPQFVYEDLNVLVISNTSIVAEKGWRQQDYAFWQEYLPYLSGADTEEIAYSDMELFASFMHNFFGFMVEESRRGFPLFVDDEFEEWYPDES